jgi:hypothetical protein
VFCRKLLGAHERRFIYTDFDRFSDSNAVWVSLFCSAVYSSSWDLNSLRPFSVGCFRSLGQPEVQGFWTMTIVGYSKKIENTAFRKLDVFPSSGEGERETYSVGSLRKNNLNHWTALDFQRLGLALTLGWKHPVSKTLRALKCRTVNKVQK